MLSTTIPPQDEAFDQFVAKVKLLDDQMRRYAAEFKGKAPQAPGTKPPRPPARNHSNNSVDSTRATPHTGLAPIDLSVQRRMEAQQAQHAKWTAEGKCTKCGSSTHWRKDCPKNRPLAAAAAAATSTAASTPFATAPATPDGSSESGNAQSPEWRLAPSRDVLVLPLPDLPVLPDHPSPHR